MRASEWLDKAGRKPVELMPVDMEAYAAFEVKRVLTPMIELLANRQLMIHHGQYHPWETYAQCDHPSCEDVRKALAVARAAIGER